MSMPYPRLLAQDFDASLRFYTEVLGAEPAKVVPSMYAHFEDESGQTRLALLRRDQLAELVPLAEPDAPAEDSLMLVLRVDDVDASVTALAAHGITVVVPPADRPGWNIRSAYVRDPDGNLVELQQY